MARLILLAAVLLSIAGPAAAEKIKISVAATNANFAQYFAAEDKGYFAAEGLDVTIVQLGGGTATPALIAGDLAYSGSPSSAMSAILRGAALKSILVGQSKPIYELWSFDPAVKRFDDLKGKSVALAARGGTDELALRMVLKQRNLPPDFLLPVLVGSLSNVVAALISGQQQNGIVTRTEKGLLAREGLLGRGRMIVNFHDEIVLQTGGLVTTAREIAEHRDRAKRVLRAVWKGTLYLMTQRDGVTALLRQRDPSLKDDILIPDVEGGMADVQRDGAMSMDAAARELAARAELNGIAPDKVPSPERVFDFSVIREVIAEIEASGWKPAP
ncbi:MAG TPA: ABC transporter substrate-binding protein [Stellaceae bacterium]|nr:ABC transporter substrate-binding protein [Stellaceae bacterium]